MGEVFPARIKAGGPLFGREPVGPKIEAVPALRAGRVGIGTPKIVPAAQSAFGASFARGGARSRARRQRACRDPKAQNKMTHSIRRQR